jgi:enoyl-CoA hydratase
VLPADTLSGLFQRALSLGPITKFLAMEQAELTFAQAADWSATLAAGLAAAGVGRGDRVVVLSANRQGEPARRLASAADLGCREAALSGRRETGGSMTLETVIYETRDGIAHVRLNRPHRLNAMVPQLMRDLHQAFQAAARDPAVRVVILSGEGRAFCAGDDLKESAQGHGGVAEIRAFVDEIQQVTTDMKTMDKPIIGAIHGYAVGGGCELALGCDLVVAADDAKFGFPETGVALFVTGGVTHFLPRAVGLAKAKELIMAGEFFDGREAERLGLVNRAVPKAEVLAAAEALARKLMEKAPISIALTKVALEAGVQSDRATAMALETVSTVTCFLTEDAREGARAFVEKRAPRYSGR